VILDEPVNGLDVEGIRWIRSLLRDMAAQGRTVFVSSHLMSEMAQTAQHLIVIGQGRLLADADVDEFIGAAASLEDAYVQLTEEAVEYRAGMGDRR
jgi:ABC-2 type transport system ATP-binding protein